MSACTMLGLSCATADESGASWPRAVTLRTDDKFGGESLRLSDGKIAEGGDVVFGVSQVLSLSSDSDAAFCQLDKYDELSAVPTDLSACTPEAWRSVFYLGGSVVHEFGSGVERGRGLLVRTGESGRLYRMWIVGHALTAQGAATVRFEYEPVE